MARELRRTHDVEQRKRIALPAPVLAKDSSSDPDFVAIDEFIQLSDSLVTASSIA
jgi:hypothetical protein